jgi:hypothetical protein
MGFSSCLSRNRIASEILGLFSSSYQCGTRFVVIVGNGVKSYETNSWYAARLRVQHVPFATLHAVGKCCASAPACCVRKNEQAARNKHW